MSNKKEHYNNDYYLENKVIDEYFIKTQITNNKLQTDDKYEPFKTYGTKKQMINDYITINTKTITEMSLNRIFNNEDKTPLLSNDITIDNLLNNNEIYLKIKNTIICNNNNIKSYIDGCMKDFMRTINTQTLGLYNTNDNTIYMNKSNWKTEPSPIEFLNIVIFFFKKLFGLEINSTDILNDISLIENIDCHCKKTSNLTYDCIYYNVNVLENIDKKYKDSLYYSSFFYQSFIGQMILFLTIDLINIFSTIVAINNDFKDIIPSLIEPNFTSYYIDKDNNNLVIIQYINLKIQINDTAILIPLFKTYFICSFEIQEFIHIYMCRDYDNISKEDIIPTENFTDFCIKKLHHYLKIYNAGIQDKAKTEAATRAANKAAKKATENKLRILAMRASIRRGGASNFIVKSYKKKTKKNYKKTKLYKKTKTYKI